MFEVERPSLKASLSLLRNYRLGPAGPERGIWADVVDAALNVEVVELDVGNKPLLNFFMR
jgi:hypothetical protein